VGAFEYLQFICLFSGRPAVKEC